MLQRAVLESPHDHCRFHEEQFEEHARYREQSHTHPAQRLHHVECTAIQVLFDTVSELKREEAVFTLKEEYVARERHQHERDA